MTTVFLSPANSLAISIGCWWKSGEIQPHLHKTCDFYLYKKGIFSKSGSLKIANGEVVHDTFWITHRMTTNETLTRDAGNKLGASLNSFIGRAKSIELDIEPVADPETLVEFLKGVKETLSAKLALTLATPFLSEKKLGANSWTRRKFDAVLPYVDGLELMVYDTGAETKQEYLVHLQNNIDAVNAWKKLYSAKQFTLGLPAYAEKTKLHRPEVENLTVVNQVTPTRHAANFAVYAGWTLTENDKKELEKLRELFIRAK